VDSCSLVSPCRQRMVHLVDPGRDRGPPDASHPERELLAGPGDASTEASGSYGPDMEERGEEEGGEDRERRGGEEEWERDMGEDRERRGGEEEERRRGGEDEWERDTHASPDLDALIG